MRRFIIFITSFLIIAAICAGGLYLYKYKFSSGWKLIENTNICVQRETKIYDDGEYEYYVSSPCVAKDTYVEMRSGEKMLLADALIENKITINDLVKKGVKINTYEKVLSWNIVSNYEMCTQEVTKIYEDNNYEYYTPTPCDAKKTYVEYTNGQKYTIEEIVNLGKIPVEELISKGAKITISSKKAEGTKNWKIARYYDQCSEVITKIYEDSNYEYYTSNPCEAKNTYVEYNDGRSYSIEEVVKLGIIPVDELNASGARISSSARVIFKPISWTISRESTTCTQVVTKIYEDSKFEYYTSTPCEARTTYVVYSNGDKYTVEEAVNLGKVTIEDLINKGVKISKEAKALTWTVQRNNTSCVQELTKIYEDKNYEYYASTPCEARETYIVYSNGAKYTVEETIKSGRLTYDDLVSVGIHLYKNAKTLSWTVSRDYKTCTEQITKIYEDTNYVYYTSNPCEARNTYIVYSNGTKYTVEEVLKTSKLSYDELKEKGVNLYKDIKMHIQPVSWTLSREYDACTQNIYTIYSDSSYDYYTSNICEAKYTYLVYSGGQKYTVEYALNNSLVTYDELVNNEVKIYRKSKTNSSDWIVQRSYTTCDESMYTMYSDSSYEYITSNECEAKNTYIVYPNGAKYTVEEAFKSNIVNYDELKGKGIHIYKQVK